MTSNAENNYGNDYKGMPPFNYGDGRYFEEAMTAHDDSLIFYMLAASALISILGLRVFYVIARAVIRVITR